jgi:pimeloyl-ACP methyl ester carboxylesterase
LMGGPGEDAIGAAEIYARQFAALRQDHDILLVDQRGTGRSGAATSSRPSDRRRAFVTCFRLQQSKDASELCVRKPI